MEVSVGGGALMGTQYDKDTWNILAWYFVGLAHGFVVGLVAFS